MKIGPLLQQEIRQTFQVVPAKSNSEEITILCPECGDASGHRSISVRTGYTYCFRCNKGANNKGYFLAWAKALGYKFTSQGGSAYSAAEIASVLNNEDAAKPMVPVVKPTSLPKGFTPIERNPYNVYSRLIAKMARRKHLSYEDFAAAGAGYTEITPRWEPYCIFPVKEYDMTVYYQGRTYVDVPGETTKRFPSRQEVPFGASYWVYNIDEARESGAKVAIVVESILNVLSLKKRFRELKITDYVPVCVFKHAVSTVQMIKLSRCRSIKELCLLFDYDAISETWKLLSTLSSRTKLTIAEMPFLHGNKKLDPNDDVDAAIEAIQARRSWTAPSAAQQKADRAFLRPATGFSLQGRRICSR